MIVVHKCPHVCTQLDLRCSAVSTLLLWAVYNQTPLLSSSGLTEEKLRIGFPLSTVTVQGLSSLMPRTMISIGARLRWLS